MTLINPVERQGRSALAPPVAFAAALVAAAAVAAAMPQGLALPGLAIALFVAAALAALLSWASHETATIRRVSYWDVAGALTFIGVCAAALVQPEQLAGLVETTPPRRD